MSISIGARASNRRGRGGLACDHRNMPARVFSALSAPAFPYSGALAVPQLRLGIRMALAASALVGAALEVPMLTGVLLTGSSLLPPAAVAAPAPPAATAKGAGTAFGASLTGDWVLNAAASQTLNLAGQGPAGGRNAGRGSPDGGGVAPEDSVLPDPPARSDPDDRRPPARRRPPTWLLRPERLEGMRALLGETRGLSILQTSTYVDLRTELTSRSLEIGTQSQVSLPTGELADQRVRWQGGRLVVERRVPRGIRVVETYRRLPETDQLEVTVRRSGGTDDGLGKVELRRIFDRDASDGPILPATSREVSR